MVASSFGSVASSLWRTSANERSDEILMCSTEMVCEVEVAFMVALFILLRCVMGENEIVIFGRLMTRETGLHQLLVAGFAVGEIAETPATGGGVFLGVLDHELHVHARTRDERLNSGAGESFGQNFVVIRRRDLVPVQRRNHASVGKWKLAFLEGFECDIVA